MDRRPDREREKKIACNFERSIYRSLKAEIAAKFTSDVYCVIEERRARGTRRQRSRSGAVFGLFTSNLRLNSLGNIS